MEFLCSLATEVANKNLKDTEAYSVLAMFLKVKDIPNLFSFCILSPNEITLFYSVAKKELFSLLITYSKEFEDNFLKRKNWCVSYPDAFIYGFFT